MSVHCGYQITAQSEATVIAWEKAMADYLGFCGSPVSEVQDVDDATFVLGPVFCAAMKMLSGLDPHGESVGKNLLAMRQAAAGASANEQCHVAAVELMVKGEFSEAARTWDALLTKEPNDLLAHKCAHESWFLIGDAQAMLASTTAAIQRLSLNDTAFSVASAQHAFALEEVGDYQAAEAWGRLALDITPSDCWALHCLTHVYESQNRHTDAMALLNAKKPFWLEQNLLNAHIWWHLALRFIELKDYDSAVEVFDKELSEVPAGNRFRLTDGTSLLWRLELDGVDVGHRWQQLADKWAQNAQLHTNPFLDMHAVLAFVSCRDLTATHIYFESLEASFAESSSELANTFNQLVKPLVSAFSFYKSQPSTFIQELEPLLPSIHRLGGSIVQRELVERSYTSALLATGQAARTEQFIAPKLRVHPNTPWLLRAAARAKEASGDHTSATLLMRRAELMFREL